MKNGDKIWLVSNYISEMISPIKAKFIEYDYNANNLVSKIKTNHKVFYVSTKSLFESKLEAEIFGTIKFLKVYYSFDPIQMIEHIPEEQLLEAHNKLEYYQENYPDLYLYYWMGNVLDK